MDTLSTGHLFLILICLLALSACFSGTETGMMSINRYRLKHHAKAHRAAARVLALLTRPDRLLGVILIGNTFANVFASAIATLLGIRLFGEYGILITTISLTLIILVFAEIMPKTIAAIHPRLIAYPAAMPLSILLWILYPIVWTANSLVNNILKIFGIKIKQLGTEALSIDELYTVVNEAGKLIPPRHKSMLLKILELEQITLEDIMVPRQEVIGIDLEDEWRDIVYQLENTPHTYLPVFRNDLNNTIGILHIRKLVTKDELTLHSLEEALTEPYFTPLNTSLHTQLLKFQQNKKRIGMVVDEYGDIMGIATLSDILEEIVGEFSDDFEFINKDVTPQQDGTYLVDGTANIRALNRTMHWSLPIEGPRTLSGAIIEHLETIPEIGTCILLNGYPIEVIQVLDKLVKTARVSPKLEHTAYSK